MADMIDMLRGMLGGPVLPPKPPPAPKMTDASEGMTGPGPNAATADQFYRPGGPSRPAPVVRPLFPSHDDTPQSLFDAFQAKGELPEALNAPEPSAHPLQIPTSGILYPPYDKPGPPAPLHQLQGLFGDPSLEPRSGSGHDLARRWTRDPNARRSANVDDERSTIPNSWALAILRAMGSQ